MNVCTFNVYKREKGNRKKDMLAKFACWVDALNYAYEKSKGEFNNENLSLVITSTMDNKVKKVYRQGLAI